MPSAPRSTPTAPGTIGKAAAARDALARLAPEPQGPRLVADDTVVGQLSRGLEAALRQGGGRVLLRLNPEHLGPVAVRLHVKGESVRAVLEPRTETARRLLADSVDSLRAALEARGLSVERIEIDGSRIDPGFVPPPITGGSPEGGRGGQREAHRPTPRGGRAAETDTGVMLALEPAGIFRGPVGGLRLDAVA